MTNTRTTRWSSADQSNEVNSLFRSMSSSIWREKDTNRNFLGKENKKLAILYTYIGILKKETSKVLR